MQGEVVGKKKGNTVRKENQNPMRKWGGGAYKVIFGD